MQYTCETLSHGFRNLDVAPCGARPLVDRRDSSLNCFWTSRRNCSMVHPFSTVTFFRVPRPSPTGRPARPSHVPQTVPLPCNQWVTLLIPPLDAEWRRLGSGCGLGVPWGRLGAFQGPSIAGPPGGGTAWPQ